MALKLYNTLTRKKQEFNPLKDKYVGMYSCGPTVYWYQHIGNLRSYINWDILKRVLSWNDYKVKHVMNVTDVGHLTSDADQGEDKIEKAAKKENKTAKEISDFYLNQFKEDFKKLNIIEPDLWPKATEHIQEMINFVKLLIKKQYTYKTKDGIYFDTSKVKDYGKLARLNIKELRAGKRVKKGLEEKRNKTDFALWKFSDKPGKRQQEWKAFGKVGFPGWHIECSVMSSKYLGKQFDIHTGGEDHIPIHHTNEIAQSESAFEIKPWVKYWIHSAFLTSKGEKVSKSKGGLYTISELEKKRFNPLVYRYFCFSAHYRKQLNFTLDILKQSENSYKRLKNITKNLKDDGKQNEKYILKFEKAINDDLDMPKAVSVLWQLLRDKKAKGKVNTIKKMDEILGLDLLKQEKQENHPEIKKLIEKRQKARENKNFKLADELREVIRKRGYYVDDTSKGQEIRKI
jgi:cysteinyl-tRNA synthetase